MVELMSSCFLLLISEDVRQTSVCRPALIRPVSTRQTEVCRAPDSLRHVFRLGLRRLRSGEDVMEKYSQETEQCNDQPDRLGDPFPICVAESYLRIGG